MDATSPSVEQDFAAGGLQMRKLLLPDGTVATASIGFLVSRGQSTSYAYLRFKALGENHKRYVGKIRVASRTYMLKDAWAKAHAKPLGKDMGFQWLWQVNSRKTKTPGK